MKCRAGFLFFILMFSIHPLFSQCKTYQLNAKHDTINCTDFQNQKQGYWYTKVVNNHGEPGYQESGFYKDNKKEGAWVHLSLVGDTLAEENYKWGYKDGVQRYYNLMGLIREESWKVTNPENPYDTVRVYDLNIPDKYDLKIVRVDASTVKHGIWTYYDPERGTITKTEEYVVDKLVNNKKSLSALNDSMNAVQKMPTDSISAANKNKPPEVLEYEKKHSKKKKYRVRDGATGVD